MYETFSSKKYMILLIFICIIFAIFVIKAFDYLPENQSDNNAVKNINSIENTKSSSDFDTSSKQQTQNNSIVVHNQKSGVLYKSEYSLHDEDTPSNEKPVLDEVKAPEGALFEEISDSETGVTQNENKLSNEELALKAIINARKYSGAGESSNAIKNYQKVAELTKDRELLAESYDGLAQLYTDNKRYGTALSFAGKAYSSSPSITREFYIAKIYYMAGQTDTAMSRINNMLKRGLK